MSPYLSTAQRVSRLDSLKIAVEETSNDSLKVLFGIETSREIHRKQHNETQEYNYTEEAVNDALSLNDTLLYAKALDNLGLLLRYPEKFDESLKLHTQAFELVKDKDVPPLNKMIFGNNAGVAGRYNQNYDRALSYYIQALKIAEKENDLMNIAISSNGIGNTLGYIPGREDDALYYFKRALEYSQKRNNSLGIAMNYLSIAGFYINRKDYKTARNYLDELLKVNQKRNDVFGLAVTAQYFGISYLEEGKDLDTAIAYFQKSYHQFKSLNHQHKQVELLANLGNCYFKKGDYSRAEAYYRQSLAHSKGLEHFGFIETNAHKLSQVLEKEGDYKAALSYFKLSKSYRDSIKLRDQNVKIEELTRKYNIEQKEAAIALLEKDKALQQAIVEAQKENIERRKSLSYLLAIACFFILIILLLQYRNYQIKKKTNARIAKEEKEKANAIYERNMAQSEILVTRLRINPHFLFNNLNAIMYLIQSEQNTKAIKYLKIFSRYTRTVLETSEQYVIPLQEELKLAHYYLMLEENRFEKDFKFTVTGDGTPGIENISIPPLLLQPFLENAIWHGLLLSKRDEKKLNIELTLEENNTKIIIDDNGIGRKKRMQQNRGKVHKSMGTQIINERIELYNKSSSVKIDYKIIDKESENGEALGTQVVLNLYTDMKEDVL